MLITSMWWHTIIILNGKNHLNTSEISNFLRNVVAARYQTLKALQICENTCFKSEFPEIEVYGRFFLSFPALIQTICFCKL